MTSYFEFNNCGLLNEKHLKPSHQICEVLILWFRILPLTLASFNESQHGPVSRDFFRESQAFLLSRDEENIFTSLLWFLFWHLANITLNLYNYKIFSVWTLSISYFVKIYKWISAWVVCFSSFDQLFLESAVPACHDRSVWHCFQGNYVLR